MAVSFVETSTLAKHYIAETGSIWLRSLLSPSRSASNGHGEHRVAVAVSGSAEALDAGDFPEARRLGMTAIPHYPNPLLEERGHKCMANTIPCA